MALAAHRSVFFSISALLALCRAFFSCGCSALRRRSASARLAICVAVLGFLHAESGGSVLGMGAPTWGRVLQEAVGKEFLSSAVGDKPGARCLRRAGRNRFVRRGVPTAQHGYSAHHGYLGSHMDFRMAL